jgi:hypothetical protein
MSVFFDQQPTGGISLTVLPVQIHHTQRPCTRNLPSSLPILLFLDQLDGDHPATYEGVAGRRVFLQPRPQGTIAKASF